MLIRYLKAGKSPKEIAFIIGCKKWGVYKFIERHLAVKAIYQETYTLRYPHKPNPLEKPIALVAVQ